MRNKIKKLWICPRCGRKFEDYQRVHNNYKNRFCVGVLAYVEKSRRKL